MTNAQKDYNYPHKNHPNSFQTIIGYRAHKLWRQLSCIKYPKIQKSPAQISTKASTLEINATVSSKFNRMYFAAIVTNNASNRQFKQITMKLGRALHVEINATYNRNLNNSTNLNRRNTEPNSALQISE